MKTVQFIKQERFDLIAGDEIVRGFALESSWECFSKYSNGAEWIIVFHEEFFASVMRDILGEPFHMPLAACSPNLAKHFRLPAG